jgi:hypothetical protein
VRSDPFDDSWDRELEVRSTAVFFAGLALTLSAIAGALLWLVFTFPVGAAKDITDEAVNLALLDACSKAYGSTTTTRPPVPAATPTTLPSLCPAPTTAVTRPSR